MRIKRLQLTSREFALQAVHLDDLRRVEGAVLGLDDVRQAGPVEGAPDVGLGLLPERRVADRTRQLEAETTERMRLQDVERARVAAELASRAKSQFLSRVSHELRTPLNGVLGFGQLLKADAAQLSPQHAAWVAHIERSGRHLLKLVDDVLDVSRIEAGGFQLDEQRFELDRLVRDCEEELRATAEAQEIDLKVEAMPARTAWRGDARRVRQVLTNLLSNAIKYNRPHGEVRIDARAANSSTRGS